MVFGDNNRRRGSFTNQRPSKRTGPQEYGTRSSRVTNSEYNDLMTVLGYAIDFKSSNKNKGIEIYILFISVEILNIKVCCEFQSL